MFTTQELNTKLKCLTNSHIYCRMLNFQESFFTHFASLRLLRVVKIKLVKYNACIRKWKPRRDTPPDVTLPKLNTLNVRRTQNVKNALTILAFYRSTTHELNTKLKCLTYCHICSVSTTHELSTKLYKYDIQL